MSRQKDLDQTVQPGYLTSPSTWRSTCAHLFFFPLSYSLILFVNISCESKLAYLDADWLTCGSVLSLTSSDRVYLRDSVSAWAFQNWLVWLLNATNMNIPCLLLGFMSTMSAIRTTNDLGHPLCHNLREGNWLMEYTYQRLMPLKETKKVWNAIYL